MESLGENIHYTNLLSERNSKETLSLLTLPIEIIYRILDELDHLSIVLSARGVCTRSDRIIDTYPHYQVNFTSIFEIRFSAPLTTSSSLICYILLSKMCSIIEVSI